MILDHVFVFVFAVVYPVTGFFGFRRLLRKIEAGMPVDRIRLFRTTIVWHWILFTAALIVWATSGRPWTGLGFGLEADGRFFLGLGIALAAVWFLVLQIRQVAAADRAALKTVRKEFGKLALLLPRNQRELFVFNALSITAGIVEETLWRGFLIWYLSDAMSLWVAGVVSTIGFGLAHGYQGLRNIPRITMVGALFTVLFVLTGSLWLPMILHAAVDILQGRLAFDVLRREHEEP